MSTSARFFLLFLILFLLGSIPQSIWIHGSVLSLTHGLGWVVTSTGISVIIVCGLLFQAERLLAYRYNTLGITEFTYIHPPTRSLAVALLYGSACIGSVILASHHMLIATWQTSIAWRLLHDAHLFANIDIIVTNQAQLLGDLWRQVRWLGITIIGVIFFGILIYTWHILLWILLSIFICAIAVFGYQFMQLTGSVPVSSIALPIDDFSIQPGLMLILESSLAGFGIVVGLSRWRGFVSHYSWLLPTMIALACVYVLLILASWHFSVLSWFEEVPKSDRLLLHIPYIFSQQDSTIAIIWFFLTPIIAWLKIGLLLYLATFLLSRLLHTPLFWMHIALSLVVGLLTLCWIGTVSVGTYSQTNAASALFTTLFTLFFQWWYPLHITVLMLIAWTRPAHEHAMFAFHQSIIIGHAMRWSYAILILVVLYMYFVLP